MKRNDRRHIWNLSETVSDRERSDPSCDRAREEKRSISGDVHVRGEIFVEATPKEALARGAEIQRAETRESQKRRLEIATLVLGIATLIVVTVYAGVTAIQADLTRHLVASQQLITRPYVGIKTVEVTHQSKDAEGNVTTTCPVTPNTPTLWKEIGH